MPIQDCATFPSIVLLPSSPPRLSSALLLLCSSLHVSPCLSHHCFSPLLIILFFSTALLQPTPSAHPPPFTLICLIFDRQETGVNHGNKVELTACACTIMTVIGWLPARPVAAVMSGTVHNNYYDTQRITPATKSCRKTAPQTSLSSHPSRRRFSKNNVELNDSNDLTLTLPSDGRIGRCSAKPTHARRSI